MDKANKISLEVSAFERDLPYLRNHGVPFTVTERNQGSDLVRIKIEPVDSYVMVSYGLAYCEMGKDIMMKRYSPVKVVA